MDEFDFVAYGLVGAERLPFALAWVASHTPRIFSDYVACIRPANAAGDEQRMWGGATELTALSMVTGYIITEAQNNAVVRGVGDTLANGTPVAYVRCCNAHFTYYKS